MLAELYAVVPTPVKTVARMVFGLRSKNIQHLKDAVNGKTGLEIGGPSGAFESSGITPIYPFAGKVDNINFAAETKWGKHSGLVREATDLHGIDDAFYDFVLSAHNLEHLANPIKALLEWRRVLKPNSALVLILPYYRRTFDHRRQPTSVSHMQEDYQCGREESDMTHLSEVLELHDRSREREPITHEQFLKRCLNNAENRCLHHHVFDEHNSRELL